MCVCVYVFVCIKFFLSSRIPWLLQTAQHKKWYSDDICPFILYRDVPRDWFLRPMNHLSCRVEKPHRNCVQKYPWNMLPSPFPNIGHCKDNLVKILVKSIWGHELFSSPWTTLNSDMAVLCTFIPNLWTELHDLCADNPYIHDLVPNWHWCMSTHKITCKWFWIIMTFNIYTLKTHTHSRYLIKSIKILIIG